MIPASLNNAIVASFEDHAARAPEQIALSFGERSYSFRELNTWANAVAHELRTRGVTRNVPVALIFESSLTAERSDAMIAGLLGIWKAGGAYLPLQAELSTTRLAFMLADSKAQVVVCDEHLTKKLGSFAGNALFLDRDAPLLEKGCVENPVPINQTRDIAYIIYTSGSTGTPKGVAVRHDNLLNYTRAIVRMLQADAEPMTFASAGTFSADLGNTAIFPSLSSGGTLRIIGYEAATDGAAFAQNVRNRQIDVLKITPSHLSALMTSGDPREMLPRKYLLLGGEASSWELIRRIRSVGTCTIINHYGPTETTIGALTYTVPAAVLPAPYSPSVPIGRPIDNTEVIVVDEALRPVADGTPGELLIAGAGVSEGYLHRPELTAERFLPNPFGDGVVFRTGDRVRRLPDGNIEFLGRLDHQVKIRGYRVELGEIEATIATHPGVMQVAVLVHEELSGSMGSGDKRLVAYIAGSADEEALRALLNERLPDHMIPSAFIPLDALPLTSNGKIDRVALAALRSTTPHNVPRLTRPKTPIEETLTSIWAEVLQCADIGIEDNFLKLGGHSLKATLIVARTRTALGVKLSLREFFQAPTIAELAGIIERKLQEKHDEELERMLNELEQLSDEEAERRLAGTNG